jgi:hypothetical protein
MACRAVGHRGKDGENDIADEKRLASYDFYKTGNTPDNRAVAICPKSKSTSAAVELIEIPTGNTKPAQETASYCSWPDDMGAGLAINDPNAVNHGCKVTGRRGRGRLDV